MPRWISKTIVFGFVLLLSACGALEKKDETLNWNAQKLYSEAKEALGDGSYDRAIRYYSTLEARYPYGRYAQQAQLETAYAHYRNNDTDQALVAINRFIRLHPNHPNVDYAYYLKGLINFNEDLGIMGWISDQDTSERDSNAAQESFDAFKLLIQRFPQSRYAQDSMLRMRYLVNSLAAHEIHVANYYMRRGAFVAASKRASAALTEYPDTPSTEQALFILAQSYDKLGMNTLRDDATRVLELNYPNSVYFRGGPKKDKPWWQIWN